MELLIRGLSLTKNIDEEWIKENCYIAGGACVSHATRQPINDVDIYFKTKEARDFFITEFGEGCYVNEDSEEWIALCNYARDPEDTEHNMGINHVTLNSVKYYRIPYKDWRINDRLVSEPLFEKQQWMFENGYDWVLLERNHFDVCGKKYLGNKSITLKFHDMIYQFILRFYGDPAEMMDKTFDFQHCKIAYDLKTKEYIADELTWMYLSRRQLKYVNSFYPLSSLKRMYKYGNRGFAWNNDVYVDIIKDIHSVDVDNKFVLEDQLIGYYEDFDYNDVFGEEEELIF